MAKRTGRRTRGKRGRNCDRGSATRGAVARLAAAGLAGALALLAAAASASAAPPATTPPTLLGSFFTQPRYAVAGVAIDPATGDVYATDSDAGTLERFTAAGTFLARLAGGLVGESGVGVDPATGDVYVCDQSGIVAKYTPAGDLVWKQQSDTEFFGLAVDPSSGDLYVADTVYSLVRKLAPGDGALLGTIPTAPSPTGLAVDPSSGDLYVVSHATNVVQRFAPDGGLIATFGSHGSGAGQFTSAYGAAVDPASGDVYVTDLVTQRVERFTSGGTFLSQFATGSGPVAVAVDPATGVVYVGVYGDSAVQLFGIPPAISGSPLDGATVYASRPSQVGRGPFTYTYQWLDCPPGGGACTANGPASASGGLRLKPSDEGQTIEVAVTETSPDGTIGPVISAPIGPVQASPPVNTAPPTVTGSTVDGNVLSATHGTWSGAAATGYTYQWQSCAAGSCADVAAYQAGYRLQPSDVGHTIQVLVSATNPDGTAGPVASAPVGPVTRSPPVNTAPPTITGAYATASRLTAHAGSWSGAPPISYAYQWQRCPDATPASCTDIPAATLGSYRLIPADTHVRLAVQATNPDGGPTTAYSMIAP